MAGIYKKGAEKMHFRFEDFGLADPESQYQLSWWSSSLDKMQMWRSGAGKPLILDEYSGYSRALHSY